MVDKENQWDDTEYNDVQDFDELEDFDQSDFNESDEELMDSEASDSSEYSEQEYDEDDDFDDDDDDYTDEVDNTRSSKKMNILPLVVVIVLLLLGAVGCFFIANSMGKKGADTSVADASAVNIEQASGDELSFEGQDFNDEDFFADDSGSSEMVAMNFDENVAPVGDGIDASSPAENTPVVPNDEAQNAEQEMNNEAIDFGAMEDTENTGNTMSEDFAANAPDNTENDLFVQSDAPLDSATANENNDIIISYDKAARVNPFKPPVFKREKEMEKLLYGELNNSGFEIIEPPVASAPDENLTRLLQTQISGILYDEESPSAIVNLNGVDNFVKVGDVVSGYKIQAITKDRVQINYKNNSYVASVGALFVKGMIESRPAVVNLEKKFAGRYKED